MGCREMNALVNKYNRLKRLEPSMTDKRKKQNIQHEIKKLRLDLKNRFNYSVEVQ